MTSTRVSFLLQKNLPRHFYGACAIVKRKHNLVSTMAVKIKKKKIVAVGGVVLLLLGMVGAGFFVWWLQSKNSDQLPVGTGGTFAETRETALPSAVDEAQQLALSGKVEESNKKLQEALAQSGLPEKERQQILAQQGVNYANSNDYQKALSFFLEAEKVKSTFTTSQLIGEMYQELGQTDKAIEYYKKALAQLDPNAQGYIMDKEYFEGKVKELGGQL